MKFIPFQKITFKIELSKLEVLERYEVRGQKQN